MTNGIKIALIVAAAILLAAAAVIYFSPYQSCVRATLNSSSPNTIGADPNYAKMKCAGA